MRLGKTGQQFAMATDAGKTVMFVLVFIYWVLGWFVASVVGFIRKDMGERFFSVINILFGLTAIGFFTGIGNIAISAATGRKDVSILMQLLYWAAIVLAVYHRWVMSRRTKRGEEWHSLFAGSSILPVPRWIAVETIHLWIEPGFLLALAYLAGKFHETPVQMWLNIGAFAIFVHEHINSYMQRQKFLDMRDAMIESRNWGSVLSGRPANETCGFTIAKSNLDMINRNPEMKDAILGLDEETRNILDKETA